MAKVKFFKLGTIVKDNVTDTEGMLTIFTVDMDKNISYVFQPKALNPKTGTPVQRFLIQSARVVGGVPMEVDIPLQILGTKAKDKATGFEGTIVSIDYHISGCIHLDVKPSGVLEETGDTIETQNFDIRRLEGKSLETFDEKKLRESLVDTPSPEAPFKKAQAK